MRIVFICICVLAAVSCRQGWSEADKKAFLDTCEKGLRAKDWIEDASSKYCSCFLEKLLQRTRSEEGFNSLPEHEKQELARNCLETLK